eukprot:218928_1
MALFPPTQLDNTEKAYIRLKEKRQEQIDKKVNNDENTLQIVDSLGGIDQIIDLYILTSETSTLTESTATQIYQIITTPKPYQMTVKQSTQQNQTIAPHKTQETHVEYHKKLNLDLILDQENNFWPKKYYKQLQTLYDGRLVWFILGIGAAIEGFFDNVPFDDFSESLIFTTRIIRICNFILVLYPIVIFLVSSANK